MDLERLKGLAERLLERSLQLTDETKQRGETHARELLSSLCTVGDLVELTGCSIGLMNS